MKFSQVIGQYEIKDKLINAYKKNRISHSYLFYGGIGVGKLALAIAFAQYISCENKTENDSCGECSSCKKYEKLIHPDLHFVFPVISHKTKKPISDSYIEEWRNTVLNNPYFSYQDWISALNSENKQGSIYKDESSEILRKLNLKTYESDYKIMIIWLPERMNVTSGNKLLKILEEPPSKTVFILVSNNREDVLQTITSRTQPIKILGIENDILKQTLIEQYQLEDADAEDIVSISNGSLLEAQKQIVLTEETQYNFNSFRNFMRMCYSRKIIEVIDFIEQISKQSREKQKDFINYCLILIRENFILNTKQNNVLYMTREEHNFSKNFSKYVNIANIYDFQDIFEQAHYHIERNVNAKIVFTDVAFKIMSTIRKK